MTKLEELRRTNRNRLFQHLGIVSLQRELTPDECQKVDLMLSVGKSISEILSALRASSAIPKRRQAETEDSLAEEVDCAPSDEVDSYCMGTPLELNFYKYADK